MRQHPGAAAGAPAVPGSQRSALGVDTPDLFHIGRAISDPASRDGSRSDHFGYCRARPSRPKAKKFGGEATFYFGMTLASVKLYQSSNSWRAAGV